MFKFKPLRGGSWLDDLGYVRLATRAHDEPGGTNNFDGFRVVCLNSSTFPINTMTLPGFKMIDIPSSDQISAFQMSETAITQAQWREVATWEERDGEQWGRELDLDPSYFKGDDRPVECVTWYDAMEFCSRLSQRTEMTYALTTEKQWEYACRAGTTTAYYVGDELIKKDANFNSEETKSVKSYPPNPWGLYEMHGNVWEWCRNEDDAIDAS